jgi:rare lipoprotein A
MPVAAARIRGDVPLPEGRPYNLGNTSADYASINATSEMSASSRSRGRSAENPRAVSYESDVRYASPSQAYLPVDPRGPSEILSGRGLY